MPKVLRAIRIEADMAAQIEAIAAAESCTWTEALRQLLAEALAARQKEQR
jgi:hypothetical protein